MLIIILLSLMSISIEFWLRGVPSFESFRIDCLLLGSITKIIVTQIQILYLLREGDSFIAAVR